MEITKNILIQGQHHRPILSDLFYTKDSKPKPIVIFIHGYKGFKDWGCWNLVGKAFAIQGLFFVKFNFSHNGGTIEDPIDFPDLEAFGQNNFTKELDDLDSIINWLHSEKSIQNEIELKNITLIGHSRGGGISILKSKEDHRITRLITWAGVSDFESRFPRGENLALWKEKGVSYIENSRTKQKMPHYYQFYENFMDNKNRLHIKNAISNLNIPHLIIHGTEDTTVPISEAKNLAKWSKTSELFEVNNANHTFGAMHPWTDNYLPLHLKETVGNSIVFVKNILPK